MMKSTRFDNFIGLFSPEKKLKRLKARAASKIFEKRSFDAASVSRRTQNWGAGSYSANAENRMGIVALRNRARELRRNNAYANKAIRVLTNSTVGSGIATQFICKNENRQKLIEKYWKEWSNSFNCDFDSKSSLKKLQKIVADGIFESGETIIRFRTVQPTKENPIPLQLQILESDFIDTDKSLDNVVQGIEYDKAGKRKGYWLFNVHPGDDSLSLKFPTSKLVDVDDICHPFEILRPGQVRGITRLAPVMIKLKDLDEFESAELVRQKVAACMSAFVHDIEAGGEEDGSSTDGEQLGERLEPGMIEFLPPGKTVSFLNPNTKEGYKEYISTVLHAVAAGAGITYESLTGELSETNYSSARMGATEFRKDVRVFQQSVMIDQFLAIVARKFLQALSLIGIKTDDVQTKHVPPQVELIDPVKEVAAKVTAIRAGISTLSDAITESGKDPEEHFEQIKKDNQILDKHGIVLDSDPRRVSGNGRFQDESKKEKGNESEEN